MYPITKYYQIPPLVDETPQQYSHRCWFIAKQSPKTMTELQQAIKWSIIDHAITFKKCTYSDEVTDIVSRMKWGKFRPNK